MALGTSASLRWSIGLVAIGLFVSGCRASRQIRDPEYVGLANGLARAAKSAAPEVDALPPVAEHLAGAQPVEAYVASALGQNARIQAARKRVDAMASRVPQAASLADPTLAVMGFPFYPAVPQTAAGRATVKMSVSQPVPWFGTLGTRASAAEAETDQARAELAAMELEVV